MTLSSYKAIVFIKKRWECNLGTLLDLNVVSNVDGRLKVDLNDRQFLFEEFAHDLLGFSRSKGSTNDDQAVGLIDEFLDSIGTIEML